MAMQVSLPDDELIARGIPCSFCATEIRADLFDDVYWSCTKRLLAATCPGCHQRTVMSFNLWRKWSGLSALS